MADTKISELAALTTPAAGDIFPIVDVSDTSMDAAGSTKGITYSTLATAIGGGVSTSTANTWTATQTFVPPDGTTPSLQVKNSAGTTTIFAVEADGALHRNDGTNMVIKSAASIDFYNGNVHEYRMAGTSSIGLSPINDNDRPLGSPSARWLDVFGARLTVCGNTAPSDASITAGHAVLWFDATNGAPKLNVKAKQANGTVVTGQWALA